MSEDQKGRSCFKLYTTKIILLIGELHNLEFIESWEDEQASKHAQTKNRTAANFLLLIVAEGLSRKIVLKIPQNTRSYPIEKELFHKQILGPISLMIVPEKPID